MRIRSSYRREGFETDGDGTLTVNDIKQIEGRRELNNRNGVYICLGDGVSNVEDGVFPLIPKLAEIEISNTVTSIYVSDETLKYLRKNDVLIRGEFDSYAEKFAKKYGLRFIHSDIKLGSAGDYFEQGVDIITLLLRYYGDPEIHQDCRCQGISAGSMGGGECSFYLPEDFYNTMTQKDIAGQCWGTCYDKIMNNEKFRVFLSKAKQKKGFRFRYSAEDKTIITEFKIIKLHLSGMKFSDDYEIVCEGEKTVISEYQRGLRDAEHTESITLDTKDVLDLLNKCGVSGWDGFNGPHPDDVQDGVMFNLRAEINGKSIRAEGSENFPPHFHEFTEFIYKALR